MDELTHLARIVTDRRLRALPLLDFGPKQANNKELALVQILVSKQVKSQKQIITSLYGVHDDASETAFRKLKSRVQQKLLNHLFFLDDSDPRHPVSRRHEQQCLSLYYQVSTLYAEGEYYNAERLGRKALRMAETMEFTHYAVLLGQLLRSIYADMQNPKQFAENGSKLDLNFERLRLEEKAGQIFWLVKSMMGQTVSARRSVLDTIDQHEQELAEISRQAGTFTTSLYHYRTLLVKLELIGDYTGIIATTSGMTERYAAGKLNKDRFDKRYNDYMSVYAHFRSGKSEEGLVLAQEFVKGFHYSSLNWMYFMELYVLMAIHARRYDQAWHLLASARDNVYFKKQRPLAQQRWDLYEVYMQFMQPEISQARIRNFNTFIQTVPDHSADKQGYNVAVLILQFLYYLRLQDTENLLIRLEGLRKYQQRHLREAGALRSQLFFKALAKTVKADFNAARSAQLAEPLIKKMKNVPPPGEAYSEIEIVPYEQLWEVTLEILRTRVDPS